MDNKRKIRIVKPGKDGEEIDKKLENIMDEDSAPMSIDNASKHEKRSGEEHHRLDDFEDSSSERTRVHRRNRIIVVACTMVFTLLVAIVVGASLALWDMGKTPGDLFAAMAGSPSGKSSDDGLTFIEGDEGETSEEDTALTFIDANEETSEEADVTEATDGEETEPKTIADNQEENQEAADDAETGDDGSSVGVVTEDGKLVVSSELSAVGSVLRAGENQAMVVTTTAQANVKNPDEGYPLPFTAVDESYFEDALFIGDSRFYGFCMWSGIPGTNYCATSFNIMNYQTFKAVQTGNGKVPIFSVMPYNAFTKIYIKVGLNEMGTSEERFEEVYAEVIEKLRQMQPRAIIYIHAVLPVTAAKSASDSTHNNPNIIARNAALKQFAAEHQCYYIDAGPVLSDSNGCLKSEMTSDGIHLASAYMGVWKQYLMEHAVVVE